MEHGYKITPYFLGSLRSHAGPCLFRNRMHQCTSSGNADSNNGRNTTGFPCRIRCDRDQKFCIQPFNADRYSRNNDRLDKPGQYPAPGCFGCRITCCVQLGDAGKRFIIPVLFHAGRDLYISLLNSPVDDGNDHRAVIIVFFFFPVALTIRSPQFVSPKP